MAIQEEALEEKTKQQSVEATNLRHKIEELERNNARLQATD